MTSPTPNDLTCDTMDATAVLAERWVRNDLQESAQEDLASWVRLRMRAYADGVWDGEDGPMAEWISRDLAIDDADARRLCAWAGRVKHERPDDPTPRAVTWMMWDWKESPTLLDLQEALEPLGVHVYADPLMEGGDTIGYMFSRIQGLNPNRLESLSRGYHGDDS